MYFTTCPDLGGKDDNLAVLILEAENKVEAEKFLSSLPLVKEKLIAFDIMPLVPYNGFERLFQH